MQEHTRVSAVWSFAQLARKHLRLMGECEARLDAIKRRQTDLDTEDGIRNLYFETAKLRQEIADHAVIVIVFSAMAVEGFIYEYGAGNLSDSFVKNYLDKLETVSKWVVIPQLVTGKRFPTDRRGFQLLQSLITERNSLVHSKSAPVTPNNTERITQLLARDYPQHAKDAVAALDELAKDLQSLDPTDLTISWSLGYLNKGEPEE